MYEQVEKPKENTSRSITNSIAQKKSNVKQVHRFVDNGPKAVAQAKLQRAARDIQRLNPATQLQSSGGGSSIQGQPIQRKGNHTGLPNQIKSGNENLSGYSLDNKKVHYNSNRSAQLHAHAYALGSNIHLAPGQEQHLPHEAWHVVQQKQGRVKPTMQLKGMVNVNGDKGLEHEADVMGSTTFQLKLKGSEVNQQDFTKMNIIQRAVVAPQMTGSNHGQTVKLKLGTGDTVAKGSTPSVDPDGYDELRTLGQSHMKKAPYWVRFHLLNEHAGGPGNDRGNLTPATSTANQATNWKNFETDIKTATAAANERPLEVSIRVNYKQSKDVYWKNGGNTVITNNENYPNTIKATLDSPSYSNKTWSLDSSDDLGIVPQEYNNDGWKAYSDSSHTTQIAPKPKP